MRRQLLNPHLTNNKGETVKQFIQSYNESINNKSENEENKKIERDDNSFIKCIIVIDDNILFIQHVVESLKNNNIITHNKGFHILIKYNNIIIYIYIILLKIINY